MKKFLLLIGLVLFTGCSCRYHLDFNGDKFIESVTLFSASGEEYNAIKKNSYAPVPAFINTPINLEEPVKTEGFEYYDMKAKNNNVYLDYKFDISNFKDSYFANISYDYFKVFVGDDDIVLSTDNRFRLNLSTYGVQSVDVVITTNHDVLFNNADEVTDGEYIWHINDVNDANIQISFSKDYKKSLLSKIFGNYVLRIIIIGVGIILFGVILGIFIRIKYKNVNKI